MQYWAKHKMHLVCIGVAMATMQSAMFVALADSGTDARSAASVGLVETVRRVTERFRDPLVANSAGYISANACVSGPQEGAMGVHFVKGTLVGDGRVDPEQPEALLYEYKAGKYRLLGVEYIVLADAGNASNQGAPVLMGQLMHYVSSPNRYGLPAFYELHVWAWENNPSGMFADWNPKVSCEEYAPSGALSSVAPHSHGM